MGAEQGMDPGMPQDPSMGGDPSMGQGQPDPQAVQALVQAGIPEEIAVAIASDPELLQAIQQDPSLLQEIMTQLQGMDQGTGQPPMGQAPPQQGMAPQPQGFSHDVNRSIPESYQKPEGMPQNLNDVSQYSNESNLLPEVQQANSIYEQNKRAEQGGYAHGDGAEEGGVTINSGPGKDAIKVSVNHTDKQSHNNPKGHGDGVQYDKVMGPEAKSHNAPGFPAKTERVNVNEKNKTAHGDGTQAPRVEIPSSSHSGGKGSNLSAASNFRNGAPAKGQIGGAKAAQSPGALPTKYAKNRSTAPGSLDKPAGGGTLNKAVELKRLLDKKKV
jgi:hypothetical protein